MVHKFICRGTIEEKINEMIERKKDLSDSLVGDNPEVRLTELSNDELLTMVRLDIMSIKQSAAGLFGVEFEIS